MSSKHTPEYSDLFLQARCTPLLNIPGIVFLMCGDIYIISRTYSQYNFILLKSLLFRYSNQWFQFSHRSIILISLNMCLIRQPCEHWVLQFISREKTQMCTTGLVIRQLYHEQVLEITSQMQSLCASLASGLIVNESQAFQFHLCAFVCVRVQEVAWFDESENQPGVLTGRLAADIPMLQNISGRRLGSMVEMFVLAVSALTIAFIYSWQITLVALAFFPILAIAGAFEVGTYYEVGPATVIIPKCLRWNTWLPLILKISAHELRKSIKVNYSNQWCHWFLRVIQPTQFLVSDQQSFAYY